MMQSREEYHRLALDCMDAIGHYTAEDPIRTALTAEAQVFATLAMSALPSVTGERPELPLVEPVGFNMVDYFEEHFTTNGGSEFRCRECGKEFSYKDLVVSENPLALLRGHAFLGCPGQEGVQNAGS